MVVAGFIACGIGVIAAGPVALLIQAYTYRRLSGGPIAPCRLRGAQPGIASAAKPHGWRDEVDQLLHPADQRRVEVGPVPDRGRGCDATPRRCRPGRRAASPAPDRCRASSPFRAGSTGHSDRPEPGRFDGLPDVDERMADDQGVRAAGTAVHRVGQPRFLRAGRPGGRRARPAVAAGPAGTPRRRRRDRRRRRGIRPPRPRSADRRPTPARRARRRGGPPRRSGRSGRPGHALRSPPPSPTPCGSGALAAGRRGAVRITGLPSTRYPGPTGNGLRRPCRSSSSIRPYSTRDHRADVAGLRVLDDHAEFYCHFSRPDRARVVRVACQNVRAVTIVHPSDPRNDRGPIPVTPRGMLGSPCCDLVAVVMRWRL